MQGQKPCMITIQRAQRNRKNAYQKNNTRLIGEIKALYFAIARTPPNQESDSSMIKKYRKMVEKVEEQKFR